jgi:hypothetical protein
LPPAGPCGRGAEPQADGVWRSARCGIAAALLLVWAAAASAEPRPLVVELFTSEGCSSCPPADAYLGRLSTRPDVIALSYHVDYWDSLGWRDRFALTPAVERQSVYAHNLNRASVYTPELVLDGRYDCLGTDEKSVLRALGEARDGVKVTLAVKDALLRVELGAAQPLRRSEVVLIPYLRHAVVAIVRGENAGRTLEEYNVVRALRPLGSWNGEARSFEVPLSSLPADSTDVAVLVQPTGQAAIIGAATHTLR